MNEIRHRKKCQRYNIPGNAHELTFSCYKNQAFFRSVLICQYMAGAILSAKEKYDFSIWAYVFMPNHIHLLICPMQEQYSISDILKSIKQSVSRRAIRYLRQNNPHGLKKLATGQKHPAYRFWQDGGGYDRNVSNEETLIKMIRYIHMNPVRCKLSDHPEQWYYSSAAQWQGGDGPIPIDFESYPVT